ncbi:hypothetical protein VMCG_10295 [Cytospora schulzeri]|uniref:AAA+ ATPase domain-containing protein n=1 Tax=Cytospora schulzeri TaxID=448051 RepID=A0A423VAK9_9PEZI|nr:hypothetical protein VMCG_10295 [Valsa malicola]
MATLHQTSTTPIKSAHEAPDETDTKELSSTNQKDGGVSRPPRKPESQEEDSDEQSSGTRIKVHVEGASRKLMRYISQLETRIRRLETGGHEEEVQTTRTRSGIIQFFLAADRPSIISGNAEDNRWKTRGTFTSEVDDVPLIRALYRWIGPKSDHEEHAPNPKDIEVLELRIASKPVVDFLNRQLEYDFGDDGVLHLVKPFRILIRNFSSIKEERDRLAKYKMADESGHPHSQAEAGATTDAGPSSRDGDSKEPQSAPSTTIDNNNNPVHDFHHLVHFVETYIGASLALYNDYAGNSLTKITFENLWMLFDIGDIIYCPLKKGGQKIKLQQVGPDRPYFTIAGLRPQAYRVSASIGGTPTERTISYSKVPDVPSSSGVKHNYFPAFDGEVEITSLEAYPIRYRTSPGVSNEDLAARGREFVDLMLVRHRKYDGLTASEKTEEVSFHARMEDETPRIRTEQDIARCEEFLDKENLLCLFEGIINGYSLRNRKWVQLDINLLQPVSYEDGWNELVLPKGHRKMVQAMVETLATESQLKTGVHDIEQRQPQPSIDKVGFDPVKQKGQGCVILLHGAPGVGKTSTAECVAAYTRRPLLPLTAGDIGYDPENVEAKLTEHFNVAQRWGCVMLLDEADKDDMQRNALVSVFLRVLEYYKGILILTTNRVGAFDEAFHSRIHLSLYYPTLGRDKTLEIFEMHFRRINKHNEERRQRGDAPIEAEKRRIQKYWKLNYEALRWNGRQIRNAFQTAMALAEYDARGSGKAPVITAKHFDTIANASADFAKYVTEVHGADADQIAMRDRNRLNHNPEARSKLKKLSKVSSSDSSDSEKSMSASSSGDDSDDVDDKKRKNLATLGY